MSTNEKRFTFQDDSVLALLCVLDPKLALSPKRNVAIAKLAYHFPVLVNEVDLDKLQDQWQDLLYAKEHLQHLSQNATSFWHELKSVKDSNNEAKFNLLSNFMCALLALPHSSACMERIFSKVNMIKTPRTNKLLVSTIANRIHAKQAIASREVKCYEWEPSQSLINDLKTGDCHKRYVERTKNIEVATFHPAEVSDSEDESLPIFLQ